MVAPSEPNRSTNPELSGGGVIGTTTAYYLTRHPDYNTAIHHITLLEATSIAAAASGKAGGLLGQWAYPSCLVPLSYRLHAELAAEHNGAERWGYRRLGCGQLSASVVSKATRGTARTRKKSSLGVVAKRESERDDDGQVEWQKLPKQDEKASSLLRDSVLPKDLDWINGSLVREYAEMGLPGFTETAQVHPYQFTTSMAALARRGGAEVRVSAKVTGIGLNKSSTAVSSVVFAADVSPYAVFTDIRLPADWVPAHRAARGERRRRHRGNVDPEIYARPGGEVYACGEPDESAPLPDTADLVQCDDAQCDDLVSYIATVSPVLAAARVAAKQACYLPRHMRFGRESAPLVGATGVRGLWVASGHTCWGIQNGPATGKLMSEFIFDGEATSADVAELDPRRYKV
ncbi:FAD dependent oxidoreductase [Annulohypoxylon bovei var. microspora]|nr:FAD dependent oxidoreductase [Annulohypoxylon bovei var. microspora]